MLIVSVLDNPEYKERIFEYVVSKWGGAIPQNVYRDSIDHCARPFPNWYLLLDKDTAAGCAGLISNDFISRSDLFPWLCALYVEEAYRGNAYGSLLIGRVAEDAAALGFDNLYLCTDHTGYYEKYGFTCIGNGYHPWGGSSRIYGKNLARRAPAP